MTYTVRFVPWKSEDLESHDEAFRLATTEEAFIANLKSKQGLTEYEEARKALDGPEYLACAVANERSEVAKKAAVIIRVIREYERVVVFGNLATEDIPLPHTLDMGGQYLTNKPRIDDRSKLFEIANMAPKGSLLHLHFNTGLHPAEILQETLRMRNMYIRSKQSLLTESDLNQTEVIFSIKEEGKIDNDVDVFSSAFTGNAENWKSATPALEAKVWMKWDSFQDKFREHFPAYKGTQIENTSGILTLSPAETWVVSKMALSADEVYAPSQTVNGIWARFNQGTRCFKGFLTYKTAYENYVGALIDRMIAEKVMYVELRPMMLDKNIFSDDGSRKIDISQQLKLLLDIVKAKKAELSRDGRLHQFPFGLKIIYCTPRSIPNKLMEKELLHCIQLKMQFPDLICGFDLVGAEDRKYPINQYIKELLAFKATCDELEIEIPFLFHAGESLIDTGGSNNPGNSNLYTAVALGAKRVGHAFALLKHPNLIPHFRRTSEQEGICVELCLISNELLHLCRNVKEHPFPALLAAGVPCSINTDNPNLFSNSMAHEFYQVMVANPRISLYTWKQLTYWSVEYSCLTREEKLLGRKYLDQSWTDCCEKIVKEYGDLVTRYTDILDQKKRGTCGEKC